MRCVGQMMITLRCMKRLVKYTMRENIIEKKVYLLGKMYSMMFENVVILKLLIVTLELFQMFIKDYMNYPQVKN